MGPARREKVGGTADGYHLYPIAVNDSILSDVQLVPSGSTEISVPFEPLNIDGAKQAMALRVGEETFQRLVEVETHFRGLLEEKHPGLIWQSALKPAGEHPALLRVKCFETLQVYDKDDNQMATPHSWRHMSLIPIVRSSAWVHKDPKDNKSTPTAGIWWTLAAVKLSDPRPYTYSFA